jgi:hypothetical protein
MRFLTQRDANANGVKSLHQGQVTPVLGISYNVRVNFKVMILFYIIHSNQTTCYKSTNSDTTLKVLLVSNSNYSEHVSIQHYSSAAI